MTLNEAIGGAQIQCDLVSLWKEEEAAEMCMHSKKAICNQRREVSREPTPANTLILSFSLQKSETSVV